MSFVGFRAQALGLSLVVLGGLPIVSDVVVPGGGGGPPRGADVSLQPEALGRQPWLAQPAFFADPLGDDDGPGSQELPWRTVAHAVDQLVAGDTLYLRGHHGPFFEHGIAIDVQGTADAPVTVCAYPGEAPVIDGGFAAYRQAPNHDWELVDAALGLYRSSGVHTGFERVHGTFGPDDGGWRLVPYESFQHLTATNQDYSESEPVYVGPGVFLDDRGRLYVRLERGVVQASMGYAVPADTDPRNTPMFLFGDDEVLEFADGARHVVLDGVALHHQDNALHVDGAQAIDVLRCDIVGGRYPVLIRAGSGDLLFHGLTIRGGFPPWVARSDVKRPSLGTSDYPWGRPAHRLQGSGVNIDGAVDAVEIRYSTFRDLFDVIGAGEQPRNLFIHHNLMDGNRDDALQLGTAGSRVEFAHNVVVRATAGVSWNGSGQPRLGEVGTKYIHHNVIDTSLPQLYGRHDPDGLLDDKWHGPAGDGMASGRPFGTHSKDEVTGPDPWKIYQNTLIGSADVDGHGLGHCYPLDMPAPSFAVPHEVFNNILVQVSDHHVAQECAVAGGGQLNDGNLYWAPLLDRESSALFDRFVDLGGRDADFTDLDAFVGSSLWMLSLPYYAPGWDSASVEGDPGLDAHYRPDGDGPAASGAVPLAARGWPSPGGTFRGAVPPAP